MKALIVSVALLTLAGCWDKSDAVHSVDQFVANQSLLKKVLMKCRNDPGELRNSPNCRNAEAADGKTRLERMREALGG